MARRPALVQEYLHQGIAIICEKRSFESLWLTIHCPATMRSLVIVTPHPLPMRKRIYFKRHRMELDLRHSRPQARLPNGFYWLPWENGVLDLHARVKFQCFAGEMDSCVFPSLGTLAGCRELMAAIATRPGFCPGATWLVAGKTLDCHPEDDGPLSGVPLGHSVDVCVATVQGLIDNERYGGIQNLGVVPEYRGFGIGWGTL